jgi:hypothetical protein
MPGMNWLEAFLESRIWLLGRWLIGVAIVGNYFYWVVLAPRYPKLRWKKLR